MKPFFVFAWLRPTPAEEKTGVAPTVILPLKVVLAKDDKHATLLAGREIPDDYDNRMERVEIAVRPF